MKSISEKRDQTYGSKSSSPDQGTKVKDITQRLDKYTYTYNQIGIYNVTFLARNANIDHSSTTTYHMVVNVVE